MRVMQRTLIAVVTASSVVSQASSSCISGGFQLKFEGECNYDSILRTFRDDVFNNPFNAPECTAQNATVEAELNSFLGGGDDDQVQQAADDLCLSAFENHVSQTTLDEIVSERDGFIQDYFNGGTPWNEYHQTNYPTDDNGDPTNVLRSNDGIVGDAERVKNAFEGVAQYGVIGWPEDLSNFETAKCIANSVMCCWPSDRQANDNNGNCAKPYDEKCVDADPGDNTDLCYVDLERGAESTGYEGKGSIFFPGDDNNGSDNAEGPIHCHGLAWSDNDGDSSFLFRGNNLFYISMYDHKHQRGYVRNVPGAPMCGCTEQMPVASRSDCTEIQINAETYEIEYDSGSWTGRVTKSNIQFNACQGTDRNGNARNNDLWSYMNRLAQEGEIPQSKLSKVSETLVGDGQCDAAIRHHQMTHDSLVSGFSAGEQWLLATGKDNLASSAPLQTLSFNQLFARSPNKIVRRICTSCASNFQDVYFKYVGDMDKVPKKLFQYLHSGNKQEEGYVYGRPDVNGTFLLYPTHEDAINDTNEYGCETYNYAGYFPGQCTPEGGSQAHQHSVFYPWPHGRRNAAFYIENPEIVASSATDEEIPSDEGGQSQGSDLTVDDSIIGIGENILSPPTARYSSSTNSYFVSVGSGDIWNTADSCAFLPRNVLTGDFTATVKIVDFEDSGRHWGKTGIMVRESLDAGSRFAFVQLTGYYGVYFTSRYQTDGNCHAARGSRDNIDSVYLKIERNGDQFMSFYMTGNGNWVQIGGAYTIEGFSEDAHVGLAVSSQWNHAIVEAEMADYTVSQNNFPTATPTISMPPAQSSEDSEDIGLNFDSAGSGSISTTGVRSLKATGHDVWADYDTFHYMSNPNDHQEFTVVAHLDSWMNNFDWSKTGIMVRMNKTPNSPHVFLLVSGEHGVRLQYREVVGGATLDINGGAFLRSNLSMKLVKQGNTFTASVKNGEPDDDSKAWTVIGNVEVDMGSDFNIGLALLGGNNNLAEANYDHYEVIGAGVEEDRRL